MNEHIEIDNAHRLLKNGVALIIALTLIATAIFVYYGEKHHGFAVKVPGGIEIYP